MDGSSILLEMGQNCSEYMDTSPFLIYFHFSSHCSMPGEFNFMEFAIKGLFTFCFYMIQAIRATNSLTLYGKTKTSVAYFSGGFF